MPQLECSAKHYATLPTVTSVLLVVLNVAESEQCAEWCEMEAGKDRTRTAGHRQAVVGPGGAALRPITMALVT